MTQVIVTLFFAEKQKKDVALPYEVPAGQLLERLIDALQLETPFEKEYHLAFWNGKKLQEFHSSETLADRKVMYGDYLQIISKERAISYAQLIAKDQTAFMLNTKNIMIGRSTPSQKVDVDVTPYDAKKIVSRLHGLIEIEFPKFVYFDQGSLHGSRINGSDLRPNSPYPLRDFDQIQLGGKGGVELKFRLDPQILKTMNHSGVSA